MFFIQKKKQKNNFATQYKGDNKQFKIEGYSKENSKVCYRCGKEGHSNAIVV